MYVGAELAALTKKFALVLFSVAVGCVFGIACIIAFDWWQTHSYQRLATKSILKPTKVFQIGFSKCGTSTIAEFFNLNGIPAIHHDFGHLATSIFANAANGKALIAPQYINYVVFTDMERMYDDPPLNVGLSLFKELDQQYPGSKFILNTRDKNAWLKSRAAHPVGSNNGPTLLQLNTQILQTSREEVIARWGAEWDTHHAAVLEYFKDRPNDLLVFNIDNDGPEKLVAFFKDDFKLQAKLYPHKNKSSTRAKLKDEAVAQVEFSNKSWDLKE